MGLNMINSYVNFISNRAVLKADVVTQEEETQPNFDSNLVQKEDDKKDESWKLVIPSIQLDAPICEGTSKEIMDSYIGHFEETSKWTGNICLAAHNRGYPKNYFAGAKNLKEGDVIEYFYLGNLRKYEVCSNSIIQDTDLTCLNDTNENTITLITCVENEPSYRRCVKAIEIN